MLDRMTTPEAVTVLCLLMVAADGEIRQEELTSMLENPFFKEHVGEKIGSSKKFLKRYVAAKKKVGTGSLEKKAVAQIKTSFPAFRTKTLALMTLIAGADENYHPQEKEFMARTATTLGIPITDVDHELSRMKDALIEQEVTQEEEKKKEAEKAQEAENSEAQNTSAEGSI